MSRADRGARELWLSRAKGWLDRVGRRNFARALGIVAKLAEFITPRMSRAEVTGAGGSPLPMPVFSFSMEMGDPGVEGPPGSDAAGLWLWRR